VPEGTIFVKVAMTRGNSRWKIIVHYVNAGKYATKRTDVRFVAWKTNVANAK
jgi:ABC-type antimicrobial peptide transport system permease subunit